MDVDAALVDVVSALLGANLVGIYAYTSDTAASLLIVTCKRSSFARRTSLTQEEFFKQETRGKTSWDFVAGLLRSSQRVGFGLLR